jgi:hypothetical protein
MFPFLPGRRVVSVHRLDLLFEAPGAKPSASRVVEFLVGHHRHSHQVECDCERLFITCVASSEWPDLYHGVLEFEPRPLPDDSSREFGTLRFTSPADRIERVFLMCGYQVG